MPCMADEDRTSLQTCYEASTDRMEANQCLNDKLTKAEEAMSSALSATRAEMARVDAATDRDEATKALSAAQRHFEEFRKANCSWYAARSSSGVGAGDLTKDCLIRMTLARAAELRTQVQQPTARLETPPVAAEPEMVAWQGGEWKLVKLIRDGEQVPLLDGSNITATFYTMGRVAGMASVNRYFGSYQLGAEHRIIWTTPAFGATRMAGPQPLMRQEQMFLDALGRATRAHVDGADLVLDSDDGNVILTFGK